MVGLHKESITVSHGKRYWGVDVTLGGGGGGGGGWPSLLTFGRVWSIIVCAWVPFLTFNHNLWSWCCCTVLHSDTFTHTVCVCV